LVDYALLVASSACFARVKSRSSLRPDSLSHQRDCWADARPPRRDGDPGYTGQLHRLPEAVGCTRGRRPGV